MKLTVEIKDGRFIYSYQVGENTHNSSSYLNADLLCSFTDLLRHCTNVNRHESKEWEREIWGKAWVEKNPEEAKKVLEEARRASKS